MATWGTDSSASRDEHDPDLPDMPRASVIPSEAAILNRQGIVSRPWQDRRGANELEQPWRHSFFLSTLRSAIDSYGWHAYCKRETT